MVNSNNPIQRRYPKRYRKLASKVRSKLDRQAWHRVDQAIAESMVALDKAERSAYTMDRADSINELVTVLARGMQEATWYDVHEEDHLRWFYNNYGRVIDAGIDRKYEAAIFDSGIDADPMTNSPFVEICIIAAGIPGIGDRFEQMLDDYRVVESRGQVKPPANVQIAYRLRTVCIRMDLDDVSYIVQAAEEKEDSCETAGNGMLI